MRRNIQKRPESASPFGGPLSRAVRVPYNLKVPESPEDAKSYGSGPTSAVPFAETPYKAAMAAANVEPLLAAHIESFYDNRLINKVLEAEKARQEAFARLTAANHRILVSNAPVLARLKALEEVRERLLKDHLADIKDLGDLRRKAVMACASALGAVRVPFDASSPLPELPPKRSLITAEATAAKANQPYNATENEHFLPKMVELAIAAFFGIMFGFSVASVAGMLHADNISQELGQATVAALFGIAVTMYAGRGVKLLWRGVAEAYDLKKKSWIGSACLATLATTACIVGEGFVDARGILASQGVKNLVAELGGKSHAGPSSDLTMYLLGTVICLPYFVYSGVSGYRKDRSAARNLVVLAQEEDRIGRLTDICADPEWQAAVAAGNQLAALDAAESLATKAYETKLGLLAKREAEIRTGLSVIRDVPPDDDIARVEKATTYAEGLQSLFDAFINAIFKGKKAGLPAAPKRVKVGILARIRSKFGRRAAGQGGS